MHSFKAKSLEQSWIRLREEPTLEVSISVDVRNETDTNRKRRKSGWQ